MVVLESLLFALALALTGLWLWMRRCHMYWRSRGVPGPAPSFPFGNCAPSCLGRRPAYADFTAVYHRHRHEPYAGLFFLHTPLLMINDLDIIKQVFIKEFQDFNGRGMYSDPERDPLSGNLFLLSGQPWRNLRVKLSPAFTSGKMRYYFGRVQECAAGLRRHVAGRVSAGGGSCQEDVRDLIARYNTDIISSLVFGMESDSTCQPEDSLMRRIGRSALEPSFMNALRFQFVFFAGDVMRLLGLSVQSPQVNALFSGIVGDNVRHREESGVQRADLLDLLIQLKNKGFLPPDKGAEAHKTEEELLQKLTLNQVVAQAFVFFAAGFETSSTTSSFLLYELARNPEVLEKATQEIDQVLEKHNGEITYDAVQNTPYLDMVMNETLRLYPPVPFLTREAMARRTLPGTGLVLDQGQILLIPVSGIHRDPDLWPRPETFDPERFSEENKAAIHPMAFMPFGDGPRICIGMRLALVQVKVALMALLSRYSVSRCASTPDPVVMEPWSPLPAPKGGLPVTLTERA